WLECAVVAKINGFPSLTILFGGPLVASYS
ncbi:hypothetical protein AVDCRST_MAG94-667, partial [uncultured Leptolyngbya sp.]